MPTLVGLQQLMEAHVRMGLNNADPPMTWWAALDTVQHLFSGTSRQSAQIAVAWLCSGGCLFSA
jgi:hypothetical protein